MTSTLRQRTTTAASSQAASHDDDDGILSHSTSSNSSDEDEADRKSTLQTTTTTTTLPQRPRKSFQDRKKIPPSIYMTVMYVILFQAVSGVYSWQTLQQWMHSMAAGYSAIGTNLWYLLQLEKADTTLTSSSSSSSSSSWLYARTWALALLSLGVVYMFLWAPLRAGLWTGSRARRHMFHRFAGLLYMAQYAAAWLEYANSYNPHSNLTHFVAINGLAQAISAYISFKVLPELDDAGYISDKAVVSRNFVHENIFFTLMCFFGSLYYHPEYRTQMQSNTLLGQGLEIIFCFGPYVMVRTWFPITRFRNAGTTHKGRTRINQTFYEWSTILIKIFFLWAKYFLGFYINFLVFLNLLDDNHHHNNNPDNTPDDPTDHHHHNTTTMTHGPEWKFVHGLYLLNLGTVSLAMFLHTLRFKGVLPPKLTMSVYLLQIYVTFSAIPLAYSLFASHWQLCSLTLTGLLCNMTRSRILHAVWCGVVMTLLLWSRHVNTIATWSIAHHHPWLLHPIEW